MRQVGMRSLPVLEAPASADALRRALTAQDAFASFGWAPSTGQRKGVYRFASFEAMERHRVESLAEAMAQRQRSAVKTQ